MIDVAEGVVVVHCRSQVECPDSAFELLGDCQCLAFSHSGACGGGRIVGSRDGQQGHLRVVVQQCHPVRGCDLRLIRVSRLPALIASAFTLIAFSGAVSAAFSVIAGTALRAASRAVARAIITLIITLSRL